MAAMTTTVTTKSEKKGAVRGASIRIASNGYTADVDREPVKTKGEAGPCCWEPTKPSVFDGDDAGVKLLQHLAAELGITCTISA